MANEIPITAQIECVERELKYRRRAYPRWIKAGKVTPQLCDRELGRMQAVLETLQQIESGERLL